MYILHRRMPVNWKMSEMKNFVVVSIFSRVCVCVFFLFFIFKSLTLSSNLVTEIRKTASLICSRIQHHAILRCIPPPAPTLLKWLVIHSAFRKITHCLGGGSLWAGKALWRELGAAEQSDLRSSPRGMLILKVARSPFPACEEVPRRLGLRSTLSCSGERKFQCCLLFCCQAPIPRYMIACAIYTESNSGFWITLSRWWNSGKIQYFCSSTHVNYDFGQVFLWLK